MESVVSLDQRFLTFYSNFPTLATIPNYYFPPSPAQHALRWQYDDIIGIDLFLLLQVYCWKA